MGWNEIIGLITGNLGIATPDLLLLIIIAFTLIFFAIDVRLGLLINFFVAMVSFIAYTNLGLSTNHILLYLMLSFGLLTLSLYITSARSIL